jgi:hypothetical protein
MRPPFQIPNSPSRRDQYIGQLAKHTATLRPSQSNGTLVSHTTKGVMYGGQAETPLPADATINTYSVVTVSGDYTTCILYSPDTDTHDHTGELFKIAKPFALQWSKWADLTIDGYSFVGVNTGGFEYVVPRLNAFVRRTKTATDAVTHWDTPAEIALHVEDVVWHEMVDPPWVPRTQDATTLAYTAGSIIVAADLVTPIELPAVTVTVDGVDFTEPAATISKIELSGRAWVPIERTQIVCEIDNGGMSIQRRVKVRSSSTFPMPAS